MKISAGVSHATHSLSGDYTGSHPDPDHSYGGARVEYDSGMMDGFLLAGSNDVYSIGYYDERDFPFYVALARNYTACDRYTRCPDISRPITPGKARSSSNSEHSHQRWRVGPISSEVK